HVREPGRAAKLAATRPVTYMIFDLLRLGGTDLLDLPYAQRRAALDGLNLAGDRWLTPPSFTDGAATLAAARELRLEGVVAKRLNSPYRPGVRSLDWIKNKAEDTAEFVVGGFRPGVRTLGALLVGVPGPGGKLLFRGRVGDRDLELSNLDKVLYPAAGFTKGEVIDYYTRMAEVLLPHLENRPLTRIRYPNGVAGNGFFEKNAPGGVPDWVRVETLPAPG